MASITPIGVLRVHDVAVGVRTKMTHDVAPPKISHFKCYKPYHCPFLASGEKL